MEEQVAYVKSPAGELGTVPAADLQSALASGYTQAAPEELESYFKEQKYGTTAQQLMTAAEGAGESLTFGLSTAFERGLGVRPEDIRSRREVNPGSHGLGQVAGIGASLLTGVGEAAILERVGAGAAAKLGLGAEKAASQAFKAAKATGATTEAASVARAAELAKFGAVEKVGSLAAKLATENALFQAGDEVSKLFSEDPQQTMGTALANMGLSGLIGAGTGVGIGVVSPLWKATVGKNVESLLNAVKNKSGGIDGLVSEPVGEALEKTGLNLSPEVKAALSDNPVLQNIAKTLEQSDTTKSGMAFQQTLQAAKKDLSDTALSALGKDAAQVEKLAELSKYEAGKKVGDALAEEIQAKVAPLAKEFEELKGKVGDVELPKDAIVESPRTIVDPQDLTGVPRTEMEQLRVPGAVSRAGDKVAELAVKEGWLAAQDTPIWNLVKFTQDNLTKQKSLKDLGHFISRVGEKAESLSSLTDRSAVRAGSMIKGILKDLEASVIEAKLGEQGAELVSRFKAVRNSWREASDLVDEIQEQIGVKSSTSGYAKAIKEFAQQDGEALLRRIAGSGNAAGLKLLQEKFPAAAEQFRQFHLDSMLKNAASRAKPGETISAKALVKEIDKLSPEMRSFLIPDEAAQKINAVSALLEQFEKAPHNFSNTARTMDKLNQYVPGGAVAMATVLSGGNPALAFVLGGLTKYVVKDAPDAIRLSLLKFLGSNQAVESGAFKAMSDVARAVYKGEAALTKGAREVFRSGSKVSSHREVYENERDKLDKQLLALQDDPARLMGVGGDLGHYLPDQAAAASYMAAQAANYLNSLRPPKAQHRPLDPKLPPDPFKKKIFERALDIAENPLIVFQDVKDGSVTPEDLVTLQNVAPGLYARMREKLMNEVVAFQSEDQEIPYKTRLGLSIFLGEPLDSTMTPEGIMAAQPKAPMPVASQGAKPSATSMQKLSKLGAENATPSQQRQMSRAKKIS